jgi:hypothetical protein
MPLHFPIHARSSHAIIPSTTARNVIAMNKLRSVNCGGHRIRKISASEPLVRTKDKYIIPGIILLHVGMGLRGLHYQCSKRVPLALKLA